MKVLELKSGSAVEVTFHTILYTRHVYPEREMDRGDAEWLVTDHDLRTCGVEIFQKKQKYGLPVWQSRSPPLNEYLSRVIECVIEELNKNTLQKVVLVVKNASIDETPIERFVFDFESLVPPDEVPADDVDFVPEDGGVTRLDLEDLFRSVLSKLMFASKTLAELKREVTFAVVVEMKDGSDMPESQAAKNKLVPVEWIPAEQRVTSEAEGRSRLNPLRTVRMGMLNMQLLVEELEGRNPPSSDMSTMTA
ncbi:hypothetical protein OIV83_000189 [Microbotryomycetes sp. JL201]|nr:hypothetical protein OIV83_000189 [Microbotryomycetes sp. JL201]